MEQNLKLKSNENYLVLIAISVALMLIWAINLLVINNFIVYCVIILGIVITVAMFIENLNRELVLLVQENPTENKQKINFRIKVNIFVVVYAVTSVFLFFETLL